MAVSNISPIRVVKTLADRADDLEVQELALLSQIQAKKQDLLDLVIKRCAIAHEQRRGIGPTLRRRQAVAADWEALLTLNESERRPVKAARTKALAALHLLRGWVAWGHFRQIVVAFELSKENVGHMFWARDGIQEILPYLKAAVPGYKCIGISHAGVFSLRYFLLCAESGSDFKIVETYQGPTDKVVFEAATLTEAIEFAQKHLAK